MFVFLKGVGVGIGGGKGEGGRGGGKGRKPPDVQVNVSSASVVKTVNVFRGDLVFTYTAVALGLSSRAS